MHQATRKSPFQLFFGTRGFNIPGNLPEIDETGNIALTDDSETEMIYNEWILNQPIVNEHSNITLTELEINETLEDQEELANQIRNNALSDFFSYSQRANCNANSNLVSRNILVGDIIKIVRDFDNNTQTRRYPFDSFYEANDYEVLRILQNNMLEIKNLNNLNDIKIVYKGRLKKINR